MLQMNHRTQSCCRQSCRMYGRNKDYTNMHFVLISSFVLLLTYYDLRSTDYISSRSTSGAHAFHPSRSLPNINLHSSNNNQNSGSNRVIHNTKSFVDTAVNKQQQRTTANNYHTTREKLVLMKQQQKDTNEVTVHGQQQKQKETDESKSSSKSVVILSAVTLITTCIIGAITGILPGYYTTISNEGVDMTLNIYMLLRDIGSTILTGILGYMFVQMNTFAVSKNYLQPRDARKIIHTLSAPLFIVLWPLFSNNIISARIFAAIVPILNAIRLYIASSSTISSESDLAKAVSRSGNINEAIGGPFIYVIMLTISILCFWVNVPHGIIAMSTMAAGDGMADLIGRRYGTNNKWPGSNKSIAGSIAFIIASSTTSYALLSWMQYNNCMTLVQSNLEMAMIVLIISTITAIVELVPYFGDDNYTVPISAAVLSILLFHS